MTASIEVQSGFVWSTIGSLNIVTLDNVQGSAQNNYSGGKATDMVVWGGGC
jgi:hypothetical protein